MLLALAAMAGTFGASAAEGPAAAELQQLEQRMAVWVRALKDKDTAAFLGCYSKARQSRYENTLVAPRKVESIAYARLAADLGKQQGWYEIFFDAGGDDVFRDHAMADGGKRWRRQGLTFTPPQADAAGRVLVRWRREGSAWVIDSVSEPSS